MGWWQVNADTLARSRFVVSPLAEATASLKTLERATAAHPGERAWLDAHLPAYRERLARDPITALLIRAALGRTWNADFLTPTPIDEDRPRLRTGGGAHPRDPARGRPRRPDRVARRPAPRRGCTAPTCRNAPPTCWNGCGETVLPYWPRRRGIIEADIIARTAQLSQGGWAAALDDMRPGMRWLGESRLQITTHDYPPREFSGARLVFVPVTPSQSWVSWDARTGTRWCTRARALLADAGRAPVPESLGRLLGPARASVLVLLETPKTTTQLVALTGQGLGSVGRHLKIMLDAGLIRRRRAGRSVLYYRTEAGEVLVAAQQTG